MEQEPKIPAPSPEKEFKPPLTAEEKERREEIRKQLAGAIHELLKQAGFKKQSSTWRREFKDVIQVVNLQRSSFSFLFYLNLGIFIKGRNPDIKNPEEHQCHYGKGFQKIGEPYGDETIEKVREKREILNFEDTSITAEEKIVKLREIIADKIMPFLDEHTSVESVEKLNNQR